jgi:uncharacterized protein YeaO (DUF488 family)
MAKVAMKNLQKFFRIRSLKRCLSLIGGGLPAHISHSGSRPLYNDRAKILRLMSVAIKRVYETAKRTDGTRVLVDRLWPRGLAKDRAAVEEWLRDLAPSDELRQWFHARPDYWLDFRKKYLKELAQPECQDGLRRLYELAHKKKRLTLLFASKDEIHNNAQILKELLDGMRKPPRGTGPGAAFAARNRKAAVRRG